VPTERPAGAVVTLIVYRLFANARAAISIRRVKPIENLKALQLGTQRGFWQALATSVKNFVPGRLAMRYTPAKNYGLSNVQHWLLRVKTPASAPRLKKNRRHPA
jgi:hypothetical protein